MITIFTTPKPFRGHFGVIQRNAIKSWSLLEPKPQVIIFGDEEGAAEIAAELNITHVREIQRSDHGTPLVSAMFNVAQELSTNPLMCFVNADIMLTGSFVRGLSAVRSSTAQFVMTGRRTLLDVQEPIDFGRANWENELIDRAVSSGKLDSWVAMDYFAFPKGLYRDMPPFVVGRARWDNWMIYSALKNDIPVIDGTEDIIAIHQNHDYSHLAGGVGDCFVSPEGQRNQELYGLDTCIGTADSTYLLGRGKLHRARGRAVLTRRLETLPIFSPRLAKMAWPILAFRDLTRLMRRRMADAGR
jgi:hypothetical protein